jgi:hypothetical protein
MLQTRRQKLKDELIDIVGDVSSLDYQDIADKVSESVCILGVSDLMRDVAEEVVQELTHGEIRVIYI